MTVKTYRLLTTKDVISVGDEGLMPDCQTWKVLDENIITVGLQYCPSWFSPIRRRTDVPVEGAQ